MITFECDYLEPHIHEYPDDWQFGGADGTDPAADPRWGQSIYIYLDERLEVAWHTSTPRCDAEALDNFTKWADKGAKYIQVIRPGETKPVLMDWVYDAETDTVSPLEG